MQANMIAQIAVSMWRNPQSIACWTYSDTSVNFIVEPVPKAIVGSSMILRVKNPLSQSKVVHLPYVHPKG